MKKIMVEYSSNNSGGSWWVNTKQWKKLEKNGWKLFNSDDFLYTPKGDYQLGKDKLPKRKEPREKDSMFGQYAHYAFKFFSSPSEAIKEFESLTGLDTTDEGCNCCGAPHSFSWEGGYCSGDDCSQYLFEEDYGLTKRQLLEKLGTNL